MSPAADNPSPTAERLQQLRLSGHLNEALELASGAITTQPPDWQAMGEGIQALIALDQAQTAARLYQAFTARPELGNNLPPPALVRLALQLGRRDLLEGMEPPADPSWLVTLLTTGEDPVASLVVADTRIRVENGHSIFTFSGSCPHCGHGQEREFLATLMALHGWVCPCCFGLVELDHRTARDAVACQFLMARDFPGARDHDLDRLDGDLVERIIPRVTGAEPAPFVVRALAQEYHFLLNEIILKAGSGVDGAGEDQS